MNSKSFYKSPIFITVVVIISFVALYQIIDAIIPFLIGIVIAYAMVALSFLVLRWKEPNLDRPYIVPFGYTVGIAALILSIGLGILYLPGSPSALLWPEEWVILIGWSVLGFLLYALSRRGRVR